MKYYCIIHSPDGSGWDAGAVVVDADALAAGLNYQQAFLGAAAFVEKLISFRVSFYPHLFLDAESLPEEMLGNSAAYDGWVPWPLDEEQEKALTERPVGFSALVVSETGWAVDIVEKHTENKYYTNRFTWAEKKHV